LKSQSRWVTLPGRKWPVQVIFRQNSHRSQFAVCQGMSAWGQEPRDCPPADHPGGSRSRTGGPCESFTIATSYFGRCSSTLEAFMPLREHFHPPLEDQTSWDLVHGMWLAFMVMDLNPHVPPRYAAGPLLNLGGSHRQLRSASIRGQTQSSAGGSNSGAEGSAPETLPPKCKSREMAAIQVRRGPHLNRNRDSSETGSALGYAGLTAPG
jgi:hypothetical protein